MNTGALLLLFILLILVALFVARPFTNNRRRFVGGDNSQLSALSSERERLLSALQELDFDHSLGKIPEEDYPLQRAALLQRGAAVLKQIDELPRAASKTTENDIEPIAATRRASVSSRPPAPPSDEDIEEMIALRRSARKDKAAGFCPQCGHPVLQADRFCPRCGKRLK